MLNPWKHCKQTKEIFKNFQLKLWQYLFKIHIYLKLRLKFDRWNFCSTGIRTYEIDTCFILQQLDQVKSFLIIKKKTYFLNDLLDFYKMCTFCGEIVTGIWCLTSSSFKFFMVKYRKKSTQENFKYRYSKYYHSRMKVDTLWGQRVTHGRLVVSHIYLMTTLLSLDLQCSFRTSTCTFLSI